MFVDKPTCYIKPFFGRYVFVRGDYQEIFSIRSDGFTLRERAICTMLTRPIFRTPRSTAPTYVRWSPQASASSSCDHPTCLRKVRMRSPNFFWILTHANTILNMLPMSLQTISSIYFNLLLGCVLLNRVKTKLLRQGGKISVSKEIYTEAVRRYLNINNPGFKLIFLRLGKGVAV